jgi:hypothetical protein
MGKPEALVLGMAGRARLGLLSNLEGLEFMSSYGLG